MVYSTHASKWRAYQFSDPFASGSFLVCDRNTHQFCRPDCEAHPVSEMHSDIVFVHTAKEAVALGFEACKFCDPVSPPKIDVGMLLLTVQEINAMIGFVPPLVDEDEQRVTQAIKENLLAPVHRRSSAPETSADAEKPAAAPKTGVYAVSKNDSEHYKLIDLACRHLASAAANSIFAPAPESALASGSSSPKSEDDASSAGSSVSSASSTSSSRSSKKKSSKKRRGGVLGFKELATKSKLSPWHFHRVFKSITGLTPKTYGDMCWEFMEKEKEAMDAEGASVQAYARARSAENAFKAAKEEKSSCAGKPKPLNLASSEASSPAVPSRDSTPPIPEEASQSGSSHAYLTPPQTAGLTPPGSGYKRTRVPEEYAPPSKRQSFAGSPHLPGFNQLKIEDESHLSMAARAASVPNLTAYNTSASSLFSHARNFNFLSGNGGDTVMPSTTSVFASALDSKNPDGFSTEYTSFSSAPQSQGISPATMENISPMDSGAVIAPELLSSNELSLVMDAHAGQGFTLSAGEIPEEEMYQNADLFPNLYRVKQEYPEYYGQDPMFSGLGPEMVRGVDY